MLLPVTCADFERAGLWDTGDCCHDCHQHPTGETMVPIVAHGPVGHNLPPVPVEVCCSHVAVIGVFVRQDVAAAIRANRRYWCTPADFNAFAPGLELPPARQGPPTVPQ